MIGLLAAVFVACEAPCPDPAACDVDADGVAAAIDCDDADPTVGGAASWVADCDADGVSGDVTTVACGAPAADALTEACDGDGGAWVGVDEPTDDCDDHDPADRAPTEWRADCDGDGVIGTTVVGCGPPDVAPAACEAATWTDAPPDTYDCDDADSAASSEATVYVDCDADGLFADGVGWCGAFDATAAAAVCGAPGGDWTDTAPPTFDCDDADGGAAAQDWYVDCDGDLAFAAVPVRACEHPRGVCDGADPAFASLSLPGLPDCDDADADVHPGAFEVAGDDVDADCDGLDVELPTDASGTFAAPGGSGTACTRTAPCATVGQAMVQAATRGVPHVYVASGTLTEPGTIPVEANIVGGLDPSRGWVPGTSRSVLTSPTANPLFQANGSDPTVHYDLSDLHITSNVGPALRAAGAADLGLSRVYLRSTTGVGVALGVATVIGSDVELVGAATAATVDGALLSLQDGRFFAIQSRLTDPIVRVGASGFLEVRRGQMEAGLGPRIELGGGAELVDVDVITRRVGARVEAGGTLTWSGGSITTCSAPIDGTECFGLSASGDATMDGVVIALSAGSTAGAVGVANLGGGALRVNDSVVVLDTGGLPGIGVGAVGPGDVVVSHSYVSLRNGTLGNAAFKVDGAAAVALVNNVVNPWSYGVLLNDGGLTLVGNRFERAAFDADVFHTVSDVGFPLSNFASGCGSMSSGCDAAGQNSVGDSGFVDGVANWRLLSTSACRDAGVDPSAWVGPPLTDLDLYGTARDDRPDCGPSEFPTD